MPMSTVVIAIVVLLLASAAIALVLPDGSRRDELGGAERYWAGFFGFFGVGAVPLALLLSVFFSTSAIATGALDLIAALHFGETYPEWFPLDALATGLGVGLLSARIFSASYPPEQAPGRSH